MAASSTSPPLADRHALCGETRDLIADCEATREEVRVIQEKMFVTLARAESNLQEAYRLLGLAEETCQLVRKARSRE